MMTNCGPTDGLLTLQQTRTTYLIQRLAKVCLSQLHCKDGGVVQLAAIIIYKEAEPWILGECSFSIHLRVPLASLTASITLSSTNLD